MKNHFLIRLFSLLFFNSPSQIALSCVDINTMMMKMKRKHREEDQKEEKKV